MAFKIGNTSIKRIFLGQVEKHFVWKGVQLVYKSITQFVTEYVSRVAADGGTTENTTNVNNLMQDLRNKDLFEDATFVMIPSGVKAGTVYSQLSKEVLGLELIINGGFDSDTIWNKNGSATISGGVANFNAVSTDRVWQGIGSLVSGDLLELSYDVISTNNIPLNINNGGGAFASPSTIPTNLGKNTIRITVTNTGSANLLLGANVGGFLGSIDNVSLKRVLTTGDLTFTRASTATFVNQQGLIETSPRNLLQRSEEIDNAVWTKASVTITTNALNSPIGVLSAELAEDLNTSSLLSQAANVPSGEVITFSIYAKRGNTDWVRILCGETFNNGFRAWFNLASGIKGNFQAFGTGTVLKSEMFNLGDGWYRISCTGTIGTSTLATSYVLTAADGTSTIRVPGGTRYIWGAQLELGSTLTPYIQTTDRLNHPRIDYSTGEPTLLLEPQRTNILLNSTNLLDNIWTKALVSTSGGVISPSGDFSAIKVVPSNNTTTFFEFYQNVTVAMNTTYTQSYYVKAAELSFCQIVGPIGVYGDFYINFDLTSGTISRLFTGSSQVVSSSIITLINGWFRISVSVVALSTSSAGRLALNFIPTGTSVRGESKTFDGTKGLFVWSPQTEQGSFPTSYIPTTTTTVTRLADSFTRNNVFTNGLIGTNGGTWFVEVKNNVPLVRDAAAFGIFLDNSSAGNVDGFAIRSGSASSVGLAIVKRISSVITTLHTLSVGSKLVVKWNGTTADVFDNGLKVVSNSSFTNTSMQFLGSQIVDAPRYIKQMALYNKPLSDAECIKLTTI